MKIAAFIVLFAVAAFGAEWVYRSFFRPVDALGPEVVALAAHFTKGGIPVTPYAVRHGYRHSQVSSAAALQIQGFPLPVSVAVCPTESAAEAFLARVAASANLTHPQRNGRLVIDLPMWGEDTEQMAAKVGNVVASFSY